MPERSKYQEKIIQNYYQNLDALMLQKLGEQVTELYLAEGKARQRRWKHVISALEKLKVPKSRIDHIHKSDDVTLLAKLLEELLESKSP